MSFRDITYLLAHLLKILRVLTMCLVIYLSPEKLVKEQASAKTDLELAVNKNKRILWFIPRSACIISLWNELYVV